MFLLFEIVSLNKPKLLHLSSVGWFKLFPPVDLSIKSEVSFSMRTNKSFGEQIPRV